MLVRCAVLFGVMLVTVAATAAPAAAHGVGGVRPTNYETRVLSVRPAVAGITVRAADLGDRLEVENRTDHDIVVLGYEDEPYLRVGPDGVFENRRSPSTYVNRTRRGNSPVPDSADSDARPEWRRVSDEPVARWHDHRAHWMGADDPPSVQREPDSTQVVQRFRVELRDRGTAITARGDVRWVPGPSPWPWLALAAVVGVAVVVLARSRVAVPALTVALGAVMIVEAAHVTGAWGATTLGVGTRMGASVYALGAIGLAGVTLVWLLRRGLYAAAPLLLITGLFVAIAGGLTDLTELTRSHLPTTLPVTVARTCVALALGLGVGLALTGGLRLRGSSDERRRRYLTRRGTPRPGGATTSVASRVEGITDEGARSHA